MSNIELPDHVNAYQLSDKQVSLAGEISVGRLKRLASLTESIEGPVKARFAFDRDESGRRIITGEVSCVVSLQCQRCLGFFRYELDGCFRLALVYNDEMAKALPADLDSLLLSPDVALDLADIAEDELLLSLPMHAMHPEENCQIKTQFGSDGKQEVKVEPHNPFDVLKILK